MKHLFKKYRLLEYHFHVPGEHNINYKIYNAELHYVFQEIDKFDSDSDTASESDDDKDRNNINTESLDICGCGGNRPNSILNILVLSRVITHVKSHNKWHVENLRKIQVDLPSYYFEYDGSIIGGGNNYMPVRWLVGDDPILFDAEQLKPFAKSARSLQNKDGRQLLYCINDCEHLDIY